MKKIPLMIVPLGVSKILAKPFIGFFSGVSRLFSGLKYDLEESDIEMSPGEYLANAFISSAFFFLLFFLLLFALTFIAQQQPLEKSIPLSFLLGLVIFLLMLFLLFRYPRILAGKKAEQIDKNLVFALKDLLLQITSGVNLYNALANVSLSGYGQVSLEFTKAVQAINTGIPMEKALEKIATESRSEYFRRALWQMINTLKAGASLKGALSTIIDELLMTQKAKISDYAHELNLWSLIYMLFAVAVPTIGSTMLVILSSFAGFGVTQGTFISFLVLSFLVQLIIISLIKSRRPLVHF